MVNDAVISVTDAFRRRLSMIYPCYSIPATVGWKNVLFSMTLDDLELL